MPNINYQLLGAGDDTQTLTQPAVVAFDGGAGFDTLNLDWRNITDGGIVFSYDKNGFWYDSGMTQGSYLAFVWGIFDPYWNQLAPQHRYYTNKGEQNQVRYKNFEQVNIWGTNKNDLLLYQNGTDYHGEGGIDVFAADWIDLTSKISWNNSEQINIGKVKPVTITSMEGVHLWLGSGNDEIDISMLGLTSAIAGNLGDDRIITGDQNDTLYGGAGNDRINGGAGEDNIEGGVGNDVLEGGNGNDVLNGNAGTDRMIGGAGNDVYYVDSKSDVVVETADGGRDTVNVSFDYDLLKVAHIENAVLLGTGNLTLQGNGEGNLLKGNAGDNHLKGLGGNDWLEGGAGNDILNGNAGADRMIGGAGNDVYYADSKSDVVVETADGGRDTVNVSFDYDLLKVAHIENAIAIGAGHIKLQGSGEGNLLKGNAGNNQLNGLGGNDWLDGGAGNDVFVGGSGRDVLVGGVGNDTFKFGGVNDSTLALKDVINDFTRGQDKIDLSAIDANTAQTSNQGFSFIGNTNFTAAGQVRFAGGVVSGDVNGDKVADFAIELKNVTKLLTSDFIL